MKHRHLVIYAAVLGAACGRGDTSPEADAGEALVPRDQTEVETPATDTAGIPTDGVMYDPDVAVPGAQPGPGPVSPPGGGSQPAPGGATAAPSPPPAADVQGDEGATILRRAAAAYENVRSLQADFVMHFENPLLRQQLTSRGTLYQRQPDRIALRFTDPAGDVIIGDGQYFYMYQPSNNPDQYFRQPAAAGGETGVNLQAQFVGNPVERFSYTLHGSESVAGRSARVLTLVPRQRAEYRSLRVWIDDRDGLARRFEITEHNGTVRRFDLQGLQVNPSISDGVFRFTPPPGARAISG